MPDHPTADYWRGFLKGHVGPLDPSLAAATTTHPPDPQLLPA